MKLPGGVARMARAVTAGVAGAVGTLVQDAANGYASARAPHSRSVTGGLTAFDRMYGLLGKPPPVDIGGYAELYVNHPTVRAVIELLARLTSTVTYQVLQGDTPVPDHPLAQLLRRPNSHIGGRRFWCQFWSWVYLAGESYVVFERDNPVDHAFVPRGDWLPNTMWVVPPNYMRPVVADVGYIDHVLYYPPSRPDYQMVIPNSDCAAYLMFNPLPYEGLRGLSPLRALWLSITTDEAARESNRMIFSNGQRPDAVISSKQFLQTDEQRRIFRESLQDLAGGDQRHSTLAIPAEVTLQKWSFSPADMEFADLLNVTAYEVCRVYHVPPTQVGLMDRAIQRNVESQEEELWKHGILPVIAGGADVLNTVLAPQFGDDLTIKPDTRGVEALRADAKYEADAVSVWVHAGFDRSWAAQRVTGDEIPPEAIAPNLPSGAGAAAPIADEEPEKAAGETVRKSGDDVSDADARRHMRRGIAQVVGQRSDGIHQALTAQCDAVLAALDALFPSDTKSLVRWQKKDAEQSADAILNLTWSQTAGDVMTAPVAATLELALLNGEARTVAKFNLSVQVGRVSPEAQAWMAETAAADVTHINETTRQAIRENLAAGLSEGEGLPDLRQRVKDAFGVGDDGQVSDVRSRMIARTEATTAYNHGADQAVQRAGLNKMWLSALLPTTRDDHADLDGVVVPPNGTWNLGGYQVSYPGQATLPAGERINCRCGIRPTTKGVTHG